jgi:hypothetical protein
MFEDLNRRRPKRQYQSLEHCRRECCAYGGRFRERFKADPTLWPCLPCGGDGWVYDPHDPPCPIEGNKLRNRLTCQGCGGSGCGPKRPVVAHYKQAVAKDKAELEQWRLRRKAYLSIRLTAEQHDALKKFGLPYTYSPTMFRDQMKRVPNP